MKKLFQGSVGTGSGTLLYTVPGGYRTDVVDINIANTTTSNITFRLHLVPSGVSVGASNALFYDVLLYANSTMQWTGVQALGPGDYIQAIASASGITANISGDEHR